MLGQAVVAECAKLSRHKGAWGLVWIFPIFVFLVFVLGTAWNLSKGLPLTTAAAADGAGFLRETTDLWKAIVQPPGRMLVGLFAALAFGGEYGWNTWKLVVPHSRRWRLIAAKYAAVLTLFAVSFILMIAVGTLVTLLKHGGLTAGGPSGLTLGAFLRAHGAAAAGAAPPALLSIAYGAAASVLLRSTMGGSVVTVLAVIGESLAMPLLNVADRWVFLALPTYHLANLAHWIDRGSGLVLPSKSGTVAWDLQSSLAVIGAWIAVLAVVTFATFERQDLN